MSDIKATKRKPVIDRLSGQTLIDIVSLKQAIANNGLAGRTGASLIGLYLTGVFDGKPVQCPFS